jgi:hypothetical protein
MTLQLLKLQLKFLKKAKQEYIIKGYEVQTLRISTQNFYNYLNQYSYNDALPLLGIFDKIAQRNGVILSIGQILPPDKYQTVLLIGQKNLYKLQLPLASACQFHPTKQEFILIQSRQLQKLFQPFQNLMEVKQISDLLHPQIARPVFLFSGSFSMKEKIALRLGLNQPILLRSFQAKIVTLQNARQTLKSLLEKT